MRHSHFRLILLTFFGAAQLCSGGGIQKWVNTDSSCELFLIFAAIQTVIARAVWNWVTYCRWIKPVTINWFLHLMSDDMPMDRRPTVNTEGLACVRFTSIPFASSDPAVVSQTFFIMSIDSFNTLSMVISCRGNRSYFNSFHFNKFPVVHCGSVFETNVDRPSSAISERYSSPSHGTRYQMVEGHMATGHILSKCQIDEKPYVARYQSFLFHVQQ